MARKTETITTTKFFDDLDGTEVKEADLQRIKFGWKGKAYAIELSKKNAAAFEKAIKPYVDKAASDGAPRQSRKGHGRASGSSRTSGSGRKDLADIRAWARDNGYQVAGRGRIPADVIAAFDAR